MVKRAAYDRLIFEVSSPGRIAYSLPDSDVPKSDPRELVPAKQLRSSPAELPEVSEFDVVRHYTRLSQMNYGVDTHFYPLGSCTMKYSTSSARCWRRSPGWTPSRSSPRRAPRASSPAS
jgi:glycine dehydrogenase subunit 2